MLARGLGPGSLLGPLARPPGFPPNPNPPPPLIPHPVHLIIALSLWLSQGGTSTHSAAMIQSTVTLSSSFEMKTSNNVELSEIVTSC